VLVQQLNRLASYVFREGVVCLVHGGASGDTTTASLTVVSAAEDQQVRKILKRRSFPVLKEYLGIAQPAEAPTACYAERLIVLVRLNLS
jgi:hypothetical protein